jgi:hypothetical protein
MSSGLRLSYAKRGLVALAVVLSALLARECAAQAAATPSATQEAAQLLRDGLCRDGAAKLNEGLAEKDPHAYFVAGFMFARGVCVAADVKRALPLLEVSAKSGWLDAARELVLIHGSGRGVQQSYAEAGRWAVAMSDIQALRSGSPDRSVVPASARALEAKSAAAFGYLAALHEFAGDAVRMFADGAIFRFEVPARVNVVVTLQLPGPSITVGEPVVERLRDGTGARQFGPTAALKFVAEVRESYERALKKLPKLDSPLESEMEVQQSYRLTLR